MEQYRNDELQKQLDETFPQWDVSIMSMATAKAAAKIGVEGSHTDADIVIDMNVHIWNESRTIWKWCPT